MRKHIELASWIAGIISTLIAIYILTETKGLISTDDIEPDTSSSINIKKGNPKKKFESCDRVFEGKYLRFNKSYFFTDTFTASKTTYINNKWITFIGHKYVDAGGDFDWTQELKDKKYIIQAKTSLTHIKTKTPKWLVDRRPIKRARATEDDFDFGISYKISYDISNNYPDTSDDIQTTSCIYYAITWCGDGEIDRNYEECDPKAKGFNSKNCDIKTCLLLGN